MEAEVLSGVSEDMVRVGVIRCRMYVYVEIRGFKVGAFM